MIDDRNDSEPGVEYVDVKINGIYGVVHLLTWGECQGSPSVRSSGTLLTPKTPLLKDAGSFTYMNRSIF